MLVQLHIDARSTEGYALHAQAKALFGAVFAGDLDRTAGTKDTMPR
jgi:2C-methyl-D-erythritol 2,4-cyclodiphosphate synthase